MIENLTEIKKTDDVRAQENAAMQQPEQRAPHGALLEPVKREKTFGEKKFNWFTYGGFALVGNEITSWFITKARETYAKKYYEPFEKFFTDLKGKRFVPEYVWNGGLPKVLLALAGGMLMVPFVKHMEDHKGEKVRAYDRKHYGDKVDTDPDLIAAHKEMDEAPKQSWSSLWKGRIVTVFAAIGVDSLVGWQDAPSTKLVEKITKPDSFWRKFSSMDRIASQVAEKSLKLFNATPTSHPNANKNIQLGSWLLVLSSTLTLLFYASSKIFAKKRDERTEHRMHTPVTPNLPEVEETADEKALEEVLTHIADEHPKSHAHPKAHDHAHSQAHPKSQVHKVKHQHTVEKHAPELAVSN